jgi:hypothetical protein
MRRFVRYALLIGFSLFAAYTNLRAQSATATLSGIVTDPTGANVAKASITLQNTSTGIKRATTTNSDGYFTVPLLPPGNYTLTVEQQGFATITNRDVILNVGDQQTLRVQLKVGQINEAVPIESGATTINAVDAARGNAIGEREVKSLPLAARNPLGLLTLQPGVVFTGQSNIDSLFQGAINKLDQREGAVNGVRGNQTNVSVDGADVNDFETQAAFTSVLPVTLDSLQEFRVTTANANATDGVAAGAQVQLVTKSGSNSFHGNLREYHRNTVTAANSFFNNAAGLERPSLLRNVFGGSVGGRIARDRAFFFFDYEGRKDASQSPQTRTGPSEQLKQGLLTYRTTTGAIETLSPAEVKALNPAGMGVNPAALRLLSLYPVGNDVNVAPDGGLSTSGVRFNAPVRTDQNIYTGRIDLNLTADGRQTLFLRGTLANIDTISQPEQFPTLPPISKLLNNSKGLAAGYTAQLSPRLVNTLRYALTRQGLENSGGKGPQIGSFAFSFFSDSGDFFTGGARANGRTVPVHDVEDDLTLIRGNHTTQVGGSLRFIRSNRFSEANSYPQYLISPFSCSNGLCSEPFDALINDGNPNNDPSDLFQFLNAYLSLTGSVTGVIAPFQVDARTQKFLPEGSPQKRRFAENGIEAYAQDAWRLRSNLTVTAGLRYSYYTPIWETNGAMVRPTVDVRDYWNRRQLDMYAGVRSDAAPLLGFDLAGKANDRPAYYAPDRNNLAPRIAVAYSPIAKSGLGRRLFGDSGKSSIRAGFGVYFQRVGGALTASTDQFGSAGLSTSLSSFGRYDLARAPRISGQPDASGAGVPPLSAFVTPPAIATFPFFFDKNSGSSGFMVDNHLSTPYTMSATLSFQRELPSRITLDVGYVGTFGRQLLSQVDVAQYYGYLRDPASGQNLWGAYNQIVDLIGPDPLHPQINPNDRTAVAQIAPIAFFENLLSNLPAFSGRPGLTATQVFYTLAAASRGSWANPLQMLDTNLTPGNSPWNRRVDPQQDGYVLFQPQFNSLPTYFNYGSSNYHGLQISVRRNAGGASFGANYALSKSIDNGSAAENQDLTVGSGTGLIPDAFQSKAHRARSDFDLRHNFNAYGVFDLPIGRGRALGREARGLLNQLIGGYALTGVWRWRSGFPLSVSTGAAFPTLLNSPGFATLTGRVSSQVTKNDPSGAPNLFSDPAAALSQFSYTRPGEVGSRNVVNGPGYFTVDLGVHKRFSIPGGETQRLEFRATVFNAFNSVNFQTQGLGGTLRLDFPETFGRFTSTAGARGGAREIEFALRYEF